MLEPYVSLCPIHAGSCEQLWWDLEREDEHAAICWLVPLKTSSKSTAIMREPIPSSSSMDGYDRDGYLESWFPELPGDSG